MATIADKVRNSKVVRFFEKETEPVIRFINHIAAEAFMVKTSLALSQTVNYRKIIGKSILYCESISITNLCFVQF